MVISTVNTIAACALPVLLLASCTMPGARVVTLKQMLERCPERHLAPPVAASANSESDALALPLETVQAPIARKGSSDGSWSVHAVVDDRMGLDFELDTGSEVTNLPDSFLQLAVCQGYISEAEINSATPTTMTNADWSSSDAENVTVHSLKIGDFVVHDMDVIHSSSPALLGSDFFMKFSAVNIDFGHGTLRLTIDKPRVVQRP